MQEHSTSISRARKTLFALILFGFQYLIYVYIIVPHFYDDIKWNNEPISELVLLIVSFVIIVLYRNSKWIVTKTSLSRRPRKHHIQILANLLIGKTVVYTPMSLLLKQSVGQIKCEIVGHTVSKQIEDKLFSSRGSSNKRVHSVF